MDNYIIRIYRYEKDNPRKFVGMVEAVERGEKQAFTNMQELWEVLNSRGRPRKSDRTRKDDPRD